MIIWAFSTKFQGSSFKAFLDTKWNLLEKISQIVEFSRIASRFVVNFLSEDTLVVDFFVQGEFFISKTFFLRWNSCLVSFSLHFYFNSWWNHSQILIFNQHFPFLFSITVAERFKFKRMLLTFRWVERMLPGQFIHIPLWSLRWKAFLFLFLTKPWQQKYIWKRLTI